MIERLVHGGRKSRKMEGVMKEKDTACFHVVHHTKSLPSSGGDLSVL